MPKTMKEQLETVAKELTTTKAKKAKVAKEVLPVSTAATWQEALTNVLQTVPQSARKIVNDATDTIISSIKARAHNEFELGTLCRKVQGAISKESFGRWLYEVVQRVGLSRASVYNYMARAEVLVAVLPYEPAREALIGVTSGKGFFKREDGKTELQGYVIAALKKFPMPATGDYLGCLDWAHEVQVAIEKGKPVGAGGNIGALSKNCRNMFERILKKNTTWAVKTMADCYRVLASTSVPLANELKDAIDKVDLEFQLIEKPGQRTETEVQHRRAIA